MTVNRTKKIRVLFVCMGNICRSPLAQGVFQNFVNEDGLQDDIVVDSAGTHSYHVGKRSDSRAVSTAAKRGYDLSNLHARAVNYADFDKFDYILAMDNENYADLLAQCDIKHQEKVNRLLEFSTEGKMIEVPDPYNGDLNDFETVLNLVEDASRSLLKQIKQTHF